MGYYCPNCERESENCYNCDRCGKIANGSSKSSTENRAALGGGE